MDAPKIALIDDEETILDIYQDYLLDNFKVETFSNAEDALEVLKRSTDFDAVVSDLKMQNMTGIMLIDKLRELKGVLLKLKPYIDGLLKQKAAFEKLVNATNKVV